jgi:cysteine-rich repeat protein
MLHSFSSQLLVLCTLLLCGGCQLPITEGHYACNPDLVGSCPTGWLCQVRGTTGTYYCYKNEAPHCGDGELTQDEVCDALQFQEYFSCESGQRLCSTLCVASCTVCGDGVREFNSLGEGEACDDGNMEDYDGCSAICTVEGVTACGNGVVDYGEACDDGNTVSGDGCSADCASDESCGNAILDDHVGETCDGTDWGSVSGCADLSYYGGLLSCGQDCNFDLSECQTYGRCGDGSVQLAHEACDGSNLGGDDCFTLGYYGGNLSCSNECQRDTSNCAVHGTCGDGIVQSSWESCDGTNLGQTTQCTGLGYYGGTLDCGTDCRYDVSDCSNYGQCGDGIVQATSEDCDGTELDGASCFSQGYYGGILVCDSSCHYAVSDCAPFGSCGDGVVQESYEGCDGTNLGGVSSCTDLGYNGGALYCDQNCQLELWDCENYGQCGNGVLEPPIETCDTTDLGGDTCLSLGYYGGAIWCGASCQRDLGNCMAYGYCGDGVLQAVLEACDGSNLGGFRNCAALGYYGGGDQVVCTASCQLDVSLCAPYGRCGDGIIQAENNETCDGTQLGAGATCEALGYYGGGAQVVCTASCQHDVSACEPHGWCGDGIAQPSHGEACDDRDLNGKACSDRGYTGGSLYCYPDCTFHESACRPRPVRIGVGGQHTCYIDTTGDGWCWGSNDHGQLGTGLGSDEQYPTPISGGHTWAQIAAADDYTCALDATGQAWCWGLGTQYGNLGLGDYSTDHATPTQVVGGHTFSTIAVAPEHSCAVDTVGQAWCWGSNDYGQLGANIYNSADATPLAVIGGHVFRAIDVGQEHTCAIDTANKAWCWGRNSGTGALGCLNCGAGGVIAVESTQEFETISAGTSHTAGTTVSWGFSYVWGQNGYGQLGLGSLCDSDTPHGVPFHFASISCDDDYTCAIDIHGVTWCWGRNSPLQLGVGGDAQSLSCSSYTIPISVVFPHRVLGEHRFVSIATSSEIVGNTLLHICALDFDEQLWCWGSGAELGNGTTDATAPIQVIFP